jgi:uncharacterized protein
VSALYEGWVGHRRLEPIEHRFRYRVVMAYLDLDAVPERIGPAWLWSARHPALVRFRRDDYLDAGAARALAGSDGPVRVLTNLRCFGHVFNPVSLYYCFDRDGTLRTVVAEVTNTPWGERHRYVLRAREGAVHDRVAKAFHVSPFMGMEHEYEAWLSAPGGDLDVRIVSRRDGAVEFDATLRLERRPLRPRTLARAALPSLAVLTRIYANALRLKLKGAPYHPHPAR